MTVAFSTVIVDGYDLAEGLSLLAAAGVDEVEPAFIGGYMPFSEATFTPAAGSELGRMIAGNGLTARAISAHIDLGAHDSAARLLRRLDFALAMGVTTVISNATSADRAEAFRATLRAVLPEFARAGAVLALENPGHGSGALIPNGAAGAQVAAAIGRPSLRLNYDIGNAVTYARGEIDIAADLAAALPWAVRLHLKDVAPEGEDWVFCALGQGFVGYGTRVLAGPCANLPPVAIEHPLRLWRPGRGDPVARPLVPDPSEVQRAVASSVRFLGKLGIA